jgi:FixJ family two-component response regulator
MRREGCAGPRIGGQPIPKHNGRPPLDWLIITPVLVKRSLVSVVDDDESVRESLPDLLREFGFAPRAFSSAEDFLASDCVDRTNCLILDIGMPRMSGPDLQKELKQRRKEIPIVFITAHRDETVRLRLLEQGAAECLFKPFSDTALLEALNAALRRN